MRIARRLTMVWMLAMVFQLLIPAQAFALTEGPAQPENKSFEPVSTTQMVDLFSGDFNYNIPLFEVPGPNGGYPLNLAYHAGITMDQEASMVGLGWNLNMGNINRQMRGLPDDYRGETVKETNWFRPNWEVGVSTSAQSPKLFGIPLTANFSFGAFYNSYRGLGINKRLGFSLQFAKDCLGLNAGLGFNSQQGLSPDFGISVDLNKSRNDNEGFSGSLSINSRQGTAGFQLNMFSSVEKKMNFTLASIRFGHNPFSAPVTQTTTTGTADLNVGFGKSFLLGNYVPIPFLTFQGYFNHTKVSSQDVSSHGYGYLYTQDATDEGSLMDFSRVKDDIITKYTTHLPVPSFNNDFYQINGQGTGGTFRPHRSNHTMLKDKKMTSEVIGGGGGVEAGWSSAPPVPAWLSSLHIAVNGSINYSNTTTKQWDAGHDNFSGQSGLLSNPFESGNLTEPWFFKNQGEQNVDVFVADQMNINEEAEMVWLQSSGLYDDALTKFVATDKMSQNGSTANSQYFKTRGESRKMRNSNIEYFTKAEVDEFGYSRYLDGAHAGMAENQIAELSVLNPDGARYVYGYPAINRKHKEAYFSIEDQVDDPNGPPMTLNEPNLHDWAKVKNDQGNEYYHSSELPAYAHDYLLTSVLGADYVDRGSPGPDDEDGGYWIKISYGNEVRGYRWRAPYGADQYNYMPGARNDVAGEQMDDKGSYMYGEKDLVYPTQIESKTHYAEFTYSDRADALESAGELPNVASQNRRPMKKLDKVTLYAKGSTVPLVTVHFEYDYSLCQRVDNNTAQPAYTPLLGQQGTHEVNQSAGKGKLTLKKVWFTYQNSRRGELSPYEFTYSDVNPEFNTQYYNRWGNFQPGLGYVPGTNGPAWTASANTASNNNVDFPWVDQLQSRADMDLYMSAWNLTKIKLPSGSEIEVMYEADDYGYVQDKEAMEMLKIESIGPVGAESAVINHGSSGLALGEDKLYFALPPDVNLNNNTSTFYKKFLEGVDKVYFRTYMTLTGRNVNGDPTFPQGLPNDADDVKDFVSGYVELDLSGGPNQGYGLSGNTGWVKIKTMDLDDNSPNTQVHPFSKAGWQYMRLNRPDYTWRPVGQQNFLSALGTILFNYNDIKALITGFNGKAMDKGACQNIDLEKSFIRLKSPARYDGNGNLLHSKFGGGHRVKEIRIRDEWENDGAVETSEYGQVYTYTTTAADGSVISSGVAQNEPGIGGEESPLRGFDGGYAEVLPFQVDNQLFTEKPYTEPYYPGPGVGYSKVSVRSISTGSSPKTKTGYTVTEFYTAKDFPIEEDVTPLQSHPNLNKFIPLGFLGKISRNDLTLSQGYSIVLNDMHGKPKCETIYGEKSSGANDFISRTTHIYKTDGGELVNTVPVLRADGLKTQAIIGRDVEMFTDMRETQTISSSVSGNFNLEVMNLFPPIPPFPSFPVVVPSTIASFSLDNSALRTATTMKIITKYGIEERVETNYMGSRVIAQNRLWDAQTGMPLLTSVTNEYEDPVYTYNYAAHWYYPGMQGAYQNYRYQHDFTSVAVNSVPGIDEIEFNSTVANPPAGRFLAGDVLQVVCTAGNASTTLSQPLTVKAIGGGGEVICYQDLSAANLSVLTAASSVTLRVIRSGHRNQQSVSSGKIVSLTDPTMSNPAGIMAELVNEILANENLCFNCNAPASQEHIFPENHPDYEYYFDLLEQVTGLRPAELRLFYDPGQNRFSVYFVGGSWNQQCKWYAQNTGTPFQGLANASAHPWQVEINSGQNLVFYDGSGSSFTFQIEGDAQACHDFFWEDRKEILHAESYTFSDEWDYDFVESNLHDVEVVNGIEQNPFALGEKGLWRVKETYLFMEARNQISQVVGTDANLRKEGIYNEFVPFTWAANFDDRWKRKNLVTRYSPFGFEIENLNALDVGSAALYGYAHCQATMTGKAALYDELAYTGFEDILDFGAVHSSGGSTIDNFGHWTVENTAAFQAGLTTDDAHTGKRSFRFDDNLNNADFLQNYSLLLQRGFMGLQANKTYLVSMWVKHEDHRTPDEVVVKVHLKLSPWSSGIGSVTDAVPVGPVIEGWRKYELKFTVNPAVGPYLAVVPAVESGTGLIDDIRVLPWEGAASTYVYDVDSRRVSAVLDDNNYAVFYDYDEQGNLIRKRRETEEGIKLLEEMRQFMKGTN